MSSDTKTVLVTGGCGYVGRRVVESLVEKGYKVTVVDIATPEERGCMFPDGVLFKQADLRIPVRALETITDATVVLHLAADIGPLNYMEEHQAEIMTNNSTIDAAVYPALIANGVRHIVGVSSSMVFERPPHFPYKETDFDELRFPKNVYGFSKLIGEYFCRAYAKQYGLTYTILRYHNIFGAGEDAKGSTPGDIHVIPALIEKVLRGEYPLQFLGDPTATRPFTYIDDAVEATVEIIKRACEADASVYNEDFNIGHDRFYTILELGEIIWKLFGDGREFVYEVKEINAHTAHRREVDITKIRTVIGWEPRTPFEEGLEATKAWIANGISK